LSKKHKVKAVDGSVNSLLNLYFENPHFASTKKGSVDNQLQARNQGGEASLQHFWPPLEKSVEHS